MSPVTGATVGATVGPGDESDDRAPTVGAGTGSGEGLGDGSGDRGAGTGAEPDASGARPRRALPWSNATYVAEKKTSPRIHVPTLSSAATERRHASSAEHEAELRRIDVELADAIRSDPGLLVRLCAIYAQDMLCLPYDVPSECKELLML